MHLLSAKTPQASFSGHLRAQARSLPSVKACVAKPSADHLKPHDLKHDDPKLNSIDPLSSMFSSIDFDDLDHQLFPRLDRSLAQSMCAAQRPNRLTNHKDQIGVLHFGIGKLFRGLWADKLHHHLKEQGVGPQALIMAMDRSTKSPGYQNLKPQDGLYSRVIADQALPADQTEIIASIADVGALDLRDDRSRAMDRMQTDAFQLASLSITPRGYALSDETISAEALALRTGEPTQTAFGLVLEGLKDRFERKASPFPIIALENLPNNGPLTKSLLLKIAAEVDTDFADWVSLQVDAPSTLVDRICPMAVGENAMRALIINDPSLELPIIDLGAVRTESYGLVAMEPCDNPLLQALNTSGKVLMTNDLDRLDKAKFGLVNGMHTLAGALYPHLHDKPISLQAMLKDPDVASFFKHLAKEIIQTLAPIEGMNFDDYFQDIWQRLTNEKLPDAMSRLAAEMPRKIPQYLSPIMQAAANQNLQTPRLWSILAAGLTHSEIPIEDFLQHIQGTDQQAFVQTCFEKAQDGNAACPLDQTLHTPLWIGQDLAADYKAIHVNLTDLLEHPKDYELRQAQPFTLFFDNDGTLVDSEVIALEAARHLINDIIEARQAGPGVSPEEFNQSFSGMNFNLILNHLNEVRPAVQLSEDDIAQYSAFEEANCIEVLKAKVQATHHTPAILDMLKTNTIDRQVVTSATLERAETALRATNLRGEVEAELFSAVDSLPKPAPKPAGDIYTHALKQLAAKSPHHKAIAVEDSASGVKSAVAAGVPVIGYLGGQHIQADEKFQRAQKLAGLGAALVIEDMAALPLALKQLNLVQHIIPHRD